MNIKKKTCCRQHCLKGGIKVYHLGAEDKLVCYFNIFEILFSKTSYIQIIKFHLPFGGFPVVCTKLNIKSVQAEPWSKPNGFSWHLRPSAVLFVDVLLWHDGLIFDEKWWLQRGSYESRGYKSKATYSIGLLIRIDAGFALGGEVTVYFEGISWAALVWINVVFA